MSDCPWCSAPRDTGQTTVDEAADRLAASLARAKQAQHEEDRRQ